MSFAPTPSQKMAIEIVDQHLAVTAGAGSGKTKVLVERYLNLVNQGIPLAKIAAITFTKKAAQEMLERLRTARPDLIRELEQAQISTIHSLCQRIIAEHPLQAVIDPRFRIGEEWETQALLLQVVEDVVEEEGYPEELGQLSNAVNQALRLYRGLLTKGISIADETLAMPPREAPASDILLTGPLRFEVEKLLQQQPTTAPQKRAMAELKEEWPRIHELLEFPDIDLQLEALEILEEVVKPIRGKFAEHTVVMRELIEEGKEFIQQLKGAEVIAWLSGVLTKIHANYNRLKNEQGILDFNDLEQLALDLLADGEVRSEYQFDHIMVDEFQDTNPKQKQIIDYLVSEGALLFVVGDPKQSIYRFRGADVGVFVDTKREIEAEGRNIYLAENFRSRPELIEFVNSLFPHIMQNTPIGFEASVARKEKADIPRVTLLRTSAVDLNLEEGRIKEAEQIALQIRKLIDAGKYKYEDIAILFRTMTNVRLYERALQAAGVPYVNLSGRGFFAQQEIRDVLHFFNWLLDPENHVSRLAVLRSPFYLLSDQALFWLQAGVLDKLSSREQEELAKSREDYAQLVQMARHCSAPEVITAMLERTHYREKTWRLPFGPQKVANIEKLLEQSWHLYTQGLVSIAEQLRYIHLMSQDSKGEGEALLDAEHADVVVLLTIHGAKGLEFPVVFLPDTSGGLFRPQTELVLYHPELGLTYKGTATYEETKKLELEAERQELQRLLYVAVTRAEEEVYFCGLDELKRARESWWRWLEGALSHVPDHLYRELAGDLVPDEQETAKQEQSELEIARYQPLQPQYQQVVFSVTSLLAYARCPRYYYFRYVLQVPENALRGSGEVVSKVESDALTGLQRGNIVHRVCEQIRHPSELDALLDYAAKMEDVNLTAGQKTQLAKIIQPYLASEFFQRVQGNKGKWDVFQEREFMVPAGNFLVNGLVDQVYRNDTGLEIVDFKSNWIRSEQVQQVGQGYSVQLRLYAWAMARQFQQQVLQSQAYFLIPDAIYQLPPDYLDLDQTENWLITTCEEIISAAAIGLSAFPAQSTCESCDLNSYCGKFVGVGKNTDHHLAQSEEELA